MSRITTHSATPIVILDSDDERAQSATSPPHMPSSTEHALTPRTALRGSPRSKPSAPAVASLDKLHVLVEPVQRPTTASQSTNNAARSAGGSSSRLAPSVRSVNLPRRHLSTIAGPVKMRTRAINGSAFSPKPTTRSKPHSISKAISSMSISQKRSELDISRSQHVLQSHRAPIPTDRAFRPTRPPKAGVNSPASKSSHTTARDRQERLIGEKRARAILATEGRRVKRRIDVAND